MNLAHLGGIDEIGVYVIPVVLAIEALRWADRHARLSANERDGEQKVYGATKSCWRKLKPWHFRKRIHEPRR